MKEYIIVKKKALFSTVAAVVFLAIAFFVWSVFLSRGERGGRPAGFGPSSYYLTAGDRHVFSFSGISPDSVFCGISFDGNRLGGGRAVSVSSQSIAAVARKTADTIAARIARLEASQAEMSYWLRVHGVRDEGYEQIVAYAARTDRQIEAARRKLAALSGIGAAQELRIIEVVTSPPACADSLSGVFVTSRGGVWLGGRWLRTEKRGRGVFADSTGSVIVGRWRSDTIPIGIMTTSGGVYRGAFDRSIRPAGHGRYSYSGGAYYEGRWADGKPCGFGFYVNGSMMKAGEWQAGSYRGEKTIHTSERIYGIDISRYQHGRGRLYWPIHWDKLRIVSLGNLSRKRISGRVDYPVSFVYIKSTEGVTVRNRYYRADYLQARRRGIPVGAYHFFSLRSDASAQARHFVRHSLFRRGDLPPVLDVEPTDSQIRAIGGPEELFRRVRQWMGIVRSRTGAKPVLYVSQEFVRKYLDKAPDLKRDYNVWIARYGEYKPDIKLLFWQLSPDGRVSGIRGDVDINVFNGYAGLFRRFLDEETIK